MSERVIDGRPKLPAPEERLALPAPERSEEAPPPTPWYRRRRSWIIAGIALALLLLLGWLLWPSGAGEEEGGGQPPAVVTADRARQVNWGNQLTAVGTVRAVQGVDVTTEVAGTVAAIRFANGGGAFAGQTLVQLDTTTERAQLRSLLAQANRARLAYERALRLIGRGAIAEAEVEQARADYQNLSAQADETRTIIEKKRIDAPFTGDLGIRQVSLGQYVGPGTAVVSLQQIAPIFIDFELPEADFAKVRAGQAVELRVDAFGGRIFRGRINAINPLVAQTTRNVTVQATVDNRDRSLRPGMFADVTVLLPGTRTVTAVPASAVTTNAYGSSVFLVARPDPRREAEKQRRQKQAEEEQGGFLSKLFGGGGSEGGGSGEGGGGSGEEKAGEAGEGGGQPKPQFVARTAFVQTGERRGLLIEVRRGLRPGQPVVTAGQLKLEDDAPITVSRANALQGAAPRPTRP